MAKMKKECRVCGKTYEACHTPSIAGVFRWQDVACSPECGAEYLRRIRASRSNPECDTASPVSSHTVKRIEIRPSELTGGFDIESDDEEDLTDSYDSDE